MYFAGLFEERLPSAGRELFSLAGHPPKRGHSLTNRPSAKHRARKRRALLPSIFTFQRAVCSEKAQRRERAAVKQGGPHQRSIQTRAETRAAAAGAATSRARGPSSTRVAQVWAAQVWAARCAGPESWRRAGHLCCATICIVPSHRSAMQGAGALAGPATSFCRGESTPSPCSYVHM